MNAHKVIRWTTNSAKNPNLIFKAMNAHDSMMDKNPNLIFKAMNAHDSMMDKNF